MKNHKISLLVISLACILSGCAAAGGNQTNHQINNETDTQTEENSQTEANIQPEEATYEQISQEEARNLMDSETDYIILDVRTEEEYADGHIVGAVCIPNETIGETVSESLPDKEQLILVYCRSGNRSVQASEKLAKFGYTNIKEFGGISTWPYDTEK